MGNNISADFDNTMEAGISTGGGNKNAGGSAYIDGQSGQQANIDAGMDGNNVYAEGGASSMTEAHAGGEAYIGHDAGPMGDAGASAGIDGYVKQGASAEGSGHIGDQGIAASGSTFAGTAAGIDATGTLDTGIVSTTASGGVSVGEQVGVGGGAEASYKDGQVNIGVSGEAAALVGLDVDVSQSVDVSAAVKTADNVAHGAENVAKDVGSSASKTAKKTGKSIKKAFSDGRLKENIVFVHSRSGINWYEYNYIWDKNTKHLGVLAQELLGTPLATAVFMHESGFYQVDYEQIG